MLQKKYDLCSSDFCFGFIFKFSNRQIFKLIYAKLFQNNSLQRSARACA